MYILQISYLITLLNFLLNIIICKKYVNFINIFFKKEYIKLKKSYFFRKIKKHEEKKNWCRIFKTNIKNNV
ncbi:hypothetical protein PFBG_05212 [Plasmodium falciparum 7G8]|uniref:Uncharacterized protein n=4 Tax=Plasmodium falciparum TaxID=5833 RepID=A0A024X1M8_PLAFC|nr:hypothetical protein PFFVO_04799 [Plasmodium falciparum Vietnam Oak-Knoll (FVO)]ETW40111.1 hypothetical protein PFNF135_06139 [Plasmodium falciparum NF135/5.C10]ETW58960.1 hypothetical protein PFMC_05145 [Plasmodium falciparum CAMP/Malaysia]EUR64056.1 hypothetical protein PFBG_05212 [Plasmodium falciparum 7G8]